MENKNIKLKLDHNHESSYKNIEYNNSIIINNDDQLNDILKNYVWIFTYFDGHLNCNNNEQILTEVKLNNANCLILGQNIPDKLFLSTIDIYKNKDDYYFPDGFCTLEEILNNY